MVQILGMVTPKLSTVVVTISYFGLWYKLSNESEEWRRCFYYQFWDMEPESDTFDPRNISKIALYSPGVSIDYLMQGFDVDISRNDSNGWQSLLGGPIEFLLTDESSENRMLAHNEFIHRNHLNDNLSYIDRLLTELQSRDVRVVLVTVPVYGRYLKHADPQILSENHRIIAGIASRYSVSYHDYSRDTRFGYQDFYDPDHLNQTGAQKFSRLLDAEVLVTQFDDHGDR